MALHYYHRYLLRTLGGKEIGDLLWKSLDDALKERLPPYLQHLDKQLCVLAEALPEFLTLLEQDEGLEQSLDLLIAVAQQVIQGQTSEREREETRGLFNSLVAHLQEASATMESDGESDLGEALEVPMETVANEPWRLGEVFGPSRLNLSRRELNRLEEVLGFTINEDVEANIDQWSQALLLHLFEIAVDPERLKGDPFPANSPVWAWAGTTKPSKGSATTKQVMEAVLNVLRYLGKLEHRQEAARYMVTRHLRSQYGLSKGRNVQNFSSVEKSVALIADQGGGEDEIEAWEPQDPDETTGLGMQGYADVDLRMVWEAVEKSAPPAQKEALHLYRRAKEAGRPLSEVCRELGKDVNLIRNNFQALKKSMKKRTKE